MVEASGRFRSDWCASDGPSYTYSEVPEGRYGLPRCRRCVHEKSVVEQDCTAPPALALPPPTAQRFVESSPGKPETGLTKSCSSARQHPCVVARAQRAVFSNSFSSCFGQTGLRRRAASSCGTMGYHSRGRFAARVSARWRDNQCAAPRSAASFPSLLPCVALRHGFCGPADHSFHRSSGVS